MTDELRAAKIAGINAAWERERELIMQGQGTRDWTPEEQLVLRDLGRIPSYAGHHMKCANAYPEYAADPDNIQFLHYTPGKDGLSEHIDGAHQGNTHQPTNGCYDYQTGQMIEFGDNPPAPPPVIELSNPYVMEVQQRREAEIAAEQAGRRSGRPSRHCRSRFSRKSRQSKRRASSWMTGSPWVTGDERTCLGASFFMAIRAAGRWHPSASGADSASATGAGPDRAAWSEQR